MNDSIWFVALVTFPEINIMKDDTYKKKKKKIDFEIIRSYNNVTCIW